MIEKVDGALPVALLARPVERASAGAAEPKTVPEQERAAVSPPPTYDLQLRVDSETSEITAVLVNPLTRAVVREIPAKEMHAASDVIRSLLGPLINKTA